VKKAERAAAPASRRRAKRILVGLNRKVYRFVTERDYACPALRSGGCTFTTERSRFGEADAMIDVLKDARKAKPLDFRRKKGQPVGVIISEQDRAKRGSAAFARNKYEFEIGYNKKDATIWRPFLCNEINRKTNLTLAEQLLGGPPAAARVHPARRPGQLAAFVSNCVGWRLQYLRELRKWVSLHSFGSCLHNNDTCAKSGRRKCNKEERALPSRRASPRRYSRSREPSSAGSARSEQRRPTCSSHAWTSAVATEEG
jgi:hypothetical protein